ncbi:NERD domain-containing protein [Bacillus sp. OAE603]|uniref:NERD domain-containing protein n=1 Tax=Gottfriedia sp. OAE603 TaxID=2663872 RepID=UPI00178988F0
MAQLIKLLDYPSRYEADIYHYPSQYVLLKREHWEKIKGAWQSNNWEFTDEENNSQIQIEDLDPIKVNDFIEDEKSFLSKILSKVRRRKRIEPDTLEQEASQIEEDNMSSILEIFKVANEYFSEDELKQKFLDELFDFQLKWASSIDLDQNEAGRKIRYDETLKYFLQSFPDNLLVMYRPVLYIGKAPIELEILIIGPIDTYCISVVKGDEHHVTIADKGNFWLQKVLKHEKKIVNPMFGLNRMGKLIKQIYLKNNIESTVHKILLTTNGFIDYQQPPKDIQIIDRRNYQQWHEGILKKSSPIKLRQLKAAKSVLALCEYTNHIDLMNEESEKE